MDVASATDGSGTIDFILCPNSTWNLDFFLPPLSIESPSSAISIRCGQNGARANACRIVGGEAHVVIEGGAVTFSGVTFDSAFGTAVSVRTGDIGVGEDVSVTATFVDCAWEVSYGTSHVSYLNSTFP